MVEASLGRRLHHAALPVFPNGDHRSCQYRLIHKSIIKVIHVTVTLKHNVKSERKIGSSFFCFKNKLIITC